MDQEFQTSFIPKKPLAETRLPKARPVNIISFLGTIIFFASLASLAGVYFYKAYLGKQVDTMSAKLASAEAAYEPTLIADLENVDRRITDAKDILKNHVMTSPIFEALEDMTLQSIRFTKFSYVYSADGKKVEVKMSGQAKDYNAIAAQSDILGKNKYIDNPVFSNLNLDDKGRVSFDLFFSVDPLFVSYQDILDRNSGGSPTDNQSPAAGGATGDIFPTDTSGGATTQ